MQMYIRKRNKELYEKVAKKVVEGKSNKEIGKELNICKYYVSALKRYKIVKQLIYYYYYKK